jgi:hypothetical protein
MAAGNHVFAVHLKPGKVGKLDRTDAFERDAAGWVRSTLVMTDTVVEVSVRKTGVFEVEELARHIERVERVCECPAHHDIGAGGDMARAREEGLIGRRVQVAGVAGDRTFVVSSVSYPCMETEPRMHAVANFERDQSVAILAPDGSGWGTFRGAWVEKLIFVDTAEAA